MVNCNTMTQSDLMPYSLGSATKGGETPSVYSLIIQRKTQHWHTSLTRHGGSCFMTEISA